MTQQSSASSLMGTTRNTGSLSRTLWTGANGNHLQIMPGKSSWGGGVRLPHGPTHFICTSERPGNGPWDFGSSQSFLGAHLNSKLEWTVNCAALYRKAQSTLYLLRRSGSFGAQRALLCGGISHFTECSALPEAFKRLNKLVRTARSGLGCPLDTVEEVSDGSMVAKLSSAMLNRFHSIQDTLTGVAELSVWTCLSLKVPLRQIKMYIIMSYLFLLDMT